MNGRNSLHVKALMYLRVSYRLPISDSSYSIGSGGLKSLMNCSQTTVNGEVARLGCSFSTLPHCCDHMVLYKNCKNNSNAVYMGGLFLLGYSEIFKYLISLNFNSTILCGKILLLSFYW